MKDAAARLWVFDSCGICQLSVQAWLLDALSVVVGKEAKHVLSGRHAA